MLRPTPHSFRFVLAAAAVGLAAAGVALAQGARHGITVQYAQIGGPHAGVDGRAYLPTTAAWVEVDSGPSSCANGRKITVSARARTGHIREIKLMVNATGPGTIPLGATGCPTGSIEATLEDGSVLRSDEGTITIRSFTPNAPTILDATFSWSPHVSGQPMPMRGIVIVPAPAAATTTAH